MSGWLTRKFICRLSITRLEYLTCRTLVADAGCEALEDGLRFYPVGWDDAAIEQYRTRFGNFDEMTYPLPGSYRRQQDGDQFQYRPKCLVRRRPPGRLEIRIFRSEQYRAVPRPPWAIGPSCTQPGAR